MGKKLLIPVAVLFLTLGFSFHTNQSYAQTLAASQTLTSGSVDFLFTTNNGQNYITMVKMSYNGTSYWATWQFNFNTLGWDLSNGANMSNITGTMSASGTYVYDTTKQLFYRQITSSTFVGNCGTWLGKLLYNVTGLTSTTLTLEKINLPGEAAQTLTFTRPSGTAGDITGTWTQVDSYGNTYYHTYNKDGTLTSTGNVVTCN